MGFDDLPYELLAEIVSYVAVAESKELAASALVGHRLVCRKFNIAIIVNLCIELGKAKLTNDGDKEHRYRMRLLSTKVVNWKVNNRILDHPLVRSLSDMVDDLVLRKGSLDRRASEQIRQQYTKNICDAVKSLGYDYFKTLVSTKKEKYDKVNPDYVLSIAQASIGEAPILYHANTTLQSVLLKDVFFLPSVLETAVAANQANLVVNLLECLMINYGDRSGLAIGMAMRVAVRLSRNTVGFLLFDFLKKHYDILGKSTRTSSMYPIIQDCIEYGNTGLFGTIMWWIWADEVPDRSSTDLRTPLTNPNICCILKHPSSTFIRYLITNNWLDPGNIGGETLLQIALSKYNWKAARKIIDAGVDINQTLPNSKKTAYEWARAEGNPDIQSFLIRWGADTRPLARHGQPWTPVEKETRLWISSRWGKIFYEHFTPAWVDVDGTDQNGTDENGTDENGTDENGTDEDDSGDDGRMKH